MFAEVAPLAAADGLDTEMRLRIPSDLTRIERVVELVATHLEARFSCHETIRLNVRVALAEALANAMQYGNRRDPAREVRLRLAWGSHRIEAEVTDEGDGFDPSAVPDPTAPERL